ncbi:MAG: hypothetical protein U0802_07710 [Candidatus Binatia bacterium]
MPLSAVPLTPTPFEPVEVPSKAPILVFATDDVERGRATSFALVTWPSQSSCGHRTVGEVGGRDIAIHDLRRVQPPRSPTLPSVVIAPNASFALPRPGHPAIATAKSANGARREQHRRLTPARASRYRPNTALRCTTSDRSPN